MIFVIGVGESDVWIIVNFVYWVVFIKLDSKWNKGDYMRDNGFIDGLIVLFMLII